MTFAAYCEKVRNEWGKDYEAFMRRDAQKNLDRSSPVPEDFPLDKEQRYLLLKGALKAASAPKVVKWRIKGLKILLSTPIGPFTGIKNPEKLTPEQIDRLYCPYEF